MQVPRDFTRVRLLRKLITKNMCAEISADATEADVLHPRTVFCTRGGLFTGLRVRDSVEANPAGSSVGLDVCCTTSVFVEGFGDFGDSCVQLGNGAPASRTCMPCCLLPTDNRTVEEQCH